MQTLFPEQKQMSTLSFLPAAKKTSTKVRRKTTLQVQGLCCLVFSKLQQTFSDRSAKTLTFMTVIFLKSSITVIFYHLTFCYSYKFVNFKGREMLRYCVIVVDHVTCSRCIVFLIWSLKVSVILTKSGSYLSKQSQMGKCPILLA